MDFDIEYNKECNCNVARIVGEVPSDEKLSMACEEMEEKFKVPVDM